PTIGASAFACCSPRGVSGTSVLPVCLPVLLHSVSPWRSNTISSMRPSSVMAQDTRRGTHRRRVRSCLHPPTAASVTAPLPPPCRRSAEEFAATVRRGGGHRLDAARGLHLQRVVRR